MINNFRMNMANFQRQLAQLSAAIYFAIVQHARTVDPIDLTRVIVDTLVHYYCQDSLVTVAFQSFVTVAFHAVAAETPIVCFDTIPSV